MEVQFMNDILQVLFERIIYFALQENLFLKTRLVVSQIIKLVPHSIK